MARKNTSTEAQRLAKTAADQYFAALAAEVPFDNPPGDVNLIGACMEIKDALAKVSARAPRTGDEEADAMNAGYLLGVEIGRRMGGA